MAIEPENPPQTEDQVSTTENDESPATMPVAMTVIVKFPEGNELKLLVLS
jgi:hypothetical protein